MKPIICIPVSKKRDILLAQIRARQLCRMLGFGPLEQAQVVCQISEVAGVELRRQRSLMLSFRVTDRILHVSCNLPVSRLEKPAKPAPAARLVLSLPVRQAALAVEDIFWALDRIQHLSKPDLFAEIRQQNNDLLYALAELKRVTFPAADRPARAEAA